MSDNEAMNNKMYTGYLLGTSALPFNVDTIHVSEKKNASCVQFMVST